MERRYYLSMRTLTGRNYPTRVLRSPDGMTTLHIVDPRASKLELLVATVDMLEPWEHEAGRAGYGQPPTGLPLLDELVEGMVMPFVPASIRVPGEVPVQNPVTTSAAYRIAYGQAIGWAINERWGFADIYRHPLPEQRQTAA